MSARHNYLRVSLGGAGGINLEVPESATGSVAQQVISANQADNAAKNYLPWIAGGLVFLLALWMLNSD